MILIQIHEFTLLPLSVSFLPALTAELAVSVATKRLLHSVKPYAYVCVCMWHKNAAPITENRSYLPLMHFICWSVLIFVAFFTFSLSLTRLFMILLMVEYK